MSFREAPSTRQRQVAYRFRNLDRDRDGLLIFFIRVVLFRVAAAVNIQTHFVVSSALTIESTGLTAISCCANSMGRTEENWCRSLAMNQLGNGLDQAGHHEDAVPVREAELSVLRRFGAPEKNVLVAQSNLAGSYSRLGRFEDASRIQRDVYSGTLNLLGAEHLNSLGGANNYATSLVTLQRFDEAKALLRRTVPVARRVLGEGHELTLTMRSLYVQTLYVDPRATLEDLREAVTTVEDMERIARRVFGGAHPLTEGIERGLQDSRAALRAREAT